MAQCIVIPAARLMEFDVFITPQWRVSPTLIRRGPHVGNYAVPVAIFDAAPEAAKLKAMFAERRADQAKWGPLTIVDIPAGDLTPPVRT